MICAAQSLSFLPDISFCKKLVMADILVLLDNVQYSKKSNANRAAIKAATGVQWITVPIFTSGLGEQQISKVIIDNRNDWQRKHLRTLEVNYKNAPYFFQYFSEIQEIYQHSWERLLKLDLSILEHVVNWLGLKNKKQVYGSKLPWVDSRTDRVIEWMKELKCDTYLIHENE